MNFHILTENKAKKAGILAEHGLSVFIQYKGKNYLFDTGQSDVFLKNADKMKVDLTNINNIIFSHGHYDHCGGFKNMVYLNEDTKIYIRKDAFIPKYALNTDCKTYRKIGVSWEREPYSKNIIFTENLTKINNHTYLLSNIPLINDFESVSSVLFKKENDKIIPDNMSDEQILIFDTEKGLVVFLGCSHPGIVNCLQHILNNFPNKKINTILAGMHLDGIEETKMNKTIEFLKSLSFERIIPLHCTGILQICKLKSEFKDKCFILNSGDSMNI